MIQFGSLSTYYIIFVFLSVNLGLDIMKQWSETGLWIAADLGSDDWDTNYFIYENLKFMIYNVIVGIFIK